LSSALCLSSDLFDSGFIHRCGVICPALADVGEDVGNFLIVQAGAEWGHDAVEFFIAYFYGANETVKYDFDGKGWIAGVPISLRMGPMVLVAMWS
jgi:hypothetical protein